MTTPSLHELALRKQHLQQRSAQLRTGLLLQSKATFGPTFRVIGQVQAGGRWLWQHPYVLSGAAALLLKRRAKSKGWLAWGGRLWSLWRAWRQIQSLVSGNAKA
jgi:hypothetical protein